MDLSSPFALVIFGATGDLAHHKLLPALFSLFKQGKLPSDFVIFGFARRPLTDEEFHNQFSLHTDPSWNDFAKHLHYQQGTFESESGYRELIERLTHEDDRVGACIMRIFYLATPPQYYDAILNNMQKTELHIGCGQGSSKWTRIAIEKPFGKNLETAKALDSKLASIFEEKQIFRVDHYLGKETVQNMIAFRFANSIFEPIWSNQYIDHVQITWAEEKGVENRGMFFDGVGILRDVAQNHLMQLVAAVAMEQPKSFTKEAIRDERANVIQALNCIDLSHLSSNVVRGQYEGYTSEDEVASASKTETFVAFKAEVNTPRFTGVPFYIRAGKKMPKTVVEIHVVFKQTCHILFKEYGCPEVGNVLTIRIQPDEGITLSVIAKKPGTTLSLETVEMKFSYKEEFGHSGRDAYEKLLLDIFTGDQLLFNRSDELESSWGFITTILNAWDAETSSVASYSSSEWGPKEAQTLIEQDGRKWL